MKKFISFTVLCLLTLNPLFFNIALADAMKSGQLNIISEFSGANIHIDGVMKGIDVVNLQQVTAGSHYVKVMDTQSNVIFNKLVTVKEGETTTIVIKQKPTGTEVMEQEPATQGIKLIDAKGSDYQLGFDNGRSDGYQKGDKDGVRQARINKSWMGWGLWAVLVLLMYAQYR